MQDDSKEHARQPRLIFQINMQIIFAITLIAVMGVASITPAFPKIRDALGLTNQQVGSLITVFTLPGIFLNPVLGVLADRYGRKTIIVPSLFIFAVAGTACAFAEEFNTLLILRFFQGVGAASIGSINVALIGDLWSGRQRATAMGTNASVLSIGTASYPAIGGALAMLGWHYPFFLSVLALPAGVWVLFSLKNPESRSSETMIRYLKGVLRYLKNGNVIVLFVISILTFVILYGSYLTYLPLALDDRFGALPYQIGLILSFGSVSTALTSPQLGRLSSRFSYKQLLIFANGLYVVSMLLIPLLGSLWLNLIPAAIFGVAQGINIPGIQTLLAGSAPMEYRAAFMSVNGMVLRLGQTLGPIVTGFAFTIAGMTATFVSGAAFAVIMAVMIVVLVKKFHV
ncbi:MAG: MFS transporter [Bacteroidales bacterium]